MAKDLFSEINNAVLDLQSSQLQTYERPLKKLAQLLRHPDLEPYNAELTEGLDVEAFIAESEKTGGSMVGSAQLAWPDDPKQALGLTLLLIEKLAANPDYATNFGHHFFYSGKKGHCWNSRTYWPANHSLCARLQELYPSQGKHGNHVKSPIFAQGLYCSWSR